MVALLEVAERTPDVTSVVAAVRATPPDEEVTDRPKVFHESLVSVTYVYRSFRTESENDRCGTEGADSSSDSDIHASRDSL